MRIGIANDMSLAREALRRVVVTLPETQVAWMAGDGAEAIAKARADRPDLILMDLIMPGVDGAEATRRIMAESPCAILVVTATVAGNLTKVYEAMGHGALDAVDTPVLGGGGRVDGAAMLLGKIATIGKLLGKPQSGMRVAFPTPAEPIPAAGRQPLVLIGSSTGGPNALACVLAALPDRWEATTIVVQHVDAAFAPGLASWLGDRSGRRVRVIAGGEVPEPGAIYLAGTNEHLLLGADGRLAYSVEPAALPYRPSVDVLFMGAAKHWPAPGVAALLTGMGRDGASGLLALRERGWHTIAQDPATCVVDGMPRAAAEIGAAVEVLPLDAIGPALVTRVRDLPASRFHPTT